MTQRCRYCGLEMGAQRLPNHEARCPRNPEMFARLREFMVGYAEDGVGLPATLYSDLAPQEPASTCRPYCSSTGCMARGVRSWRRAGWSIARTMR